MTDMISDFLPSLGVDIRITTPLFFTGCTNILILVYLSDLSYFPSLSFRMDYAGFVFQHSSIFNWHGSKIS